MDVACNKQAKMMREIFKKETGRDLLLNHPKKARLAREAIKFDFPEGCLKVGADKLFWERGTALKSPEQRKLEFIRELSDHSLRLACPFFTDCPSEIRHICRAMVGKINSPR